MRFSDESAPVYLEVAAEPEVVAALDGAISGQLEKMQPMYFAINPFGLVLALLAGSAAAVAVFSATLAIKSLCQASQGADIGAEAVVIAVEAMFFGLSVAAGWFANRPKGLLFPTAAFAIGRETSRRRLLKVLRGGLFLVTAGFLLAVIILNIEP